MDTVQFILLQGQLDLECGKVLFLDYIIYENSNELIVLMSACYIMLTLSEQIEIYSISSYYSFVLITIHSQSASESIHTDLTGHGEKIFRRHKISFFVFVLFLFVCLIYIYKLYIFAVLSSVSLSALDVLPPHTTHPSISTSSHIQKPFCIVPCSVVVRGPQEETSDC